MMITECSISDVQVLRTVKTGVSTVGPLLQNSKVITMTGVNVKAQRRPIFDKAEDLDKAYKLARYVPVDWGKMQEQCTKPGITYDHAKKAVTKHNMQQF